MSIEETQHYLRRKNNLYKLRSPFDPLYRDLSRYFLPFTGRFYLKDPTVLPASNYNTYDNTSIRAARIFSNGLAASLTSSATDWFQLTIEDYELSKYRAVKEWLYIVTQALRSIINKSNTYKAFRNIYAELIVYGTAATIISDNVDTIIHHTPLTAGQYAIGLNHLDQVDTLCRSFCYTTAQLVSKFGYNNCSRAVQIAYNNKEYDVAYEVCHIIEPNYQRDIQNNDNKNMAFKSIYFEIANDNDKVLSSSGFKEFPALVPRYQSITGEAYGWSPGMEALGDAKQLQALQLRKGEVEDYQTKPPLLVPSQLRNNQINRLPGGITYYDGHADLQQIQTLFNVNLNPNLLLASITDTRGRIDASMFVDFFTAILQDDRSNITAAEIAEKRAEKISQLVPIVESAENELLAPFIDIVFNRLMDVKNPDGTSFIPPAPPELQGKPLKIDFISSLAQSVKMAKTTNLDKFFISAANLAKVYPQALDKIDFDKMVDTYASALNIDPELIKDDAIVAQTREQHQQIQQNMQLAQTAPMMAKAAKTMSQVDKTQLRKALDPST